MMEYKKGDRVKIKDTNQVGVIKEVIYDYVEIELPDGKTVIKEASEFILITFFEWLLRKIKKWAGK